MRKIRFISLLAFCVLILSLNIYAQTTTANFDFNSATGYPVAATSTATQAYSTDGTNFTNSGTTLSPGNGNFVSGVFDLSGLIALNNQSNLTLRLLASGASGSGTLRIGNLQVQATGPSAAPGKVSGRVKNEKEPN